MSKRELIEPTPGDKRYARRDDEGRFTEMDDVAAHRPRTRSGRPRRSLRKVRATAATGGTSAVRG